MLLERIEALETAVEKLAADVRAAKASATRANKAAKAAADAVEAEQ